MAVEGTRVTPGDENFITVTTGVLNLVNGSDFITVMTGAPNLTNGSDDQPWEVSWAPHLKRGSNASVT